MIPTEVPLCEPACIPVTLPDDGIAERGYYLPTVAATVDDPNVAWVDAANALLQDDSYATVELVESEASEVLLVDVFPFAIPATATILGVKIRVRCFYNPSGEMGVQLYDDTGAIGDIEYQTLGESIDPKDYVFGGASSLFGATLTPAQINAATFGIGLGFALIGAAGGICYVDSIDVKVYYKP